MKKLLLAGIVLMAFVFQYCSSTKKVQPAVTPVAKVTYKDNIAPVISISCTPCHISGLGKKKSYDNYANAKADVDDIIARISKNPGEHGFMPSKHPKLSDSTIQLFAAWRNGGMAEN